MKRMNAIIAKLLLIFIIPFSLYSQDKKHAGVGSVSEIVVPFAASIRNNFNLFYEIHQNKHEGKIPSFWYKIVFNKACTFQFTLFPLYEEDGYNFFLFKIAENQNFCKAYDQESIQSYGTERLFKTYKDREQSEEFRANLVEIKPVAVNAGDAIYIEVVSTKGKDRGHILDFRTSDNSFVVKVINDEVENPADTTMTNVKYIPKKIETSEQAISALGDVLCNVAKKNVFISSIQIKGEEIAIKQFVDVAVHGEIKKVKDTVPTKLINQPIELINQPIAEVATLQPKKDTVYSVKSTADLNALEVSAAPPIYYSMSTLGSSKSNKNATRLEVDNVLFSLLQEDLKRKIKSLDEQIKKQRELLRKNKNKAEREELKGAIAKIEGVRSQYVIKSIDTKHKLKEINKLLREEKRLKISPEKSVFASSMSADVNKNNSTSTVVEDTANYQRKISEMLVYKVQIGVYKSPVSPNLFKGLTPVFEEIFPGGVRYSAGAFANFEDAKLAKEYIKNMGLTDAFVIAYYKGQKISVADAKLLEGKEK